MNVRIVLLLMVAFLQNSFAEPNTIGGGGGGLNKVESTELLYGNGGVGGGPRLSFEEGGSGGGPRLSIEQTMMDKKKEFFVKMHSSVKKMDN